MRLSASQEAAAAAKKAALQLKIKQAGLGGQKLGKHKVPENRIDVQIGEDLSESLRELKVCSGIGRRCCEVVTDENKLVARRQPLQGPIPKPTTESSD